MSSKNTAWTWVRRINAGVVSLSAVTVLIVTSLLMFEQFTGNQLLKPNDEIVYEESIAYTFQVYETAWEQLDVFSETNNDVIVENWKDSINHAIAYTDGIAAPERYRDHKTRTMQELKKIPMDDELLKRMVVMLDELKKYSEAEDKTEVAYNEYFESSGISQLTKYQVYKGADAEKRVLKSRFYESKDSFWEAAQEYHNIIRPLGREISDNKLD